MNQPDPEALYIALIGDTTRLRAVRRLQYRCSARCLLLDALAVGETVLLHQKRFKNSPEWNDARSSAAGRAANTSDGINHWLPRNFYIESSALHLADAESATLGVQCDHIEKSMKPSEFARHWTAGRSEVTIRRDGTMFVVR